ncbi:unnamed protein product [Cladocopium goreaui]|uniref:Uncharacterized protein n=1 Tax=Cladocopium goreaui TaxID=2562237 RepID=A0A9P1CE89_9DINO|nr:unnamed protein product [Cladocopium goreaui]
MGFRTIFDISRHGSLGALLLSNGADINAQDRYLATPLHKAAAGQSNLAKELVKNGADVGREDRWRSTPLHKAAEHGKAELASLLLSEGAGISADEWGATPLHRAVHRGQLAVVETLLANGGDANAEDLQWAFSGPEPYCSCTLSFLVLGVAAAFCVGVTREEDSWELVTDPGPEVPELAAEVASATAASGAEFRAANFVPTIDFVEEEAGALFASDTNTALGEWHFERLAGLEADPDFPSPGVARARLARAVRAGLGARYKLDRRARTTCKSPHVPGIKRWYVVLRSRDFPEGFITEAIETVLQEWVDGEGYPVAIYEAADAVIETMRGRTLGTASVLLVDMPWLGAAQFRRPIALRRDATDSILRITVEDQIGRPRSNEAWAASEAWLLSKEPDDVLQEYYSADSGGGGEEFPEQIPGADHAPVGEDQSDVIRQMQARIQQLEAEAAGRTSLLAAPAPAQELFPMQMAAGGLRQEDWDQLQKLAGPAPKRAPRPEAATAYRGEEFDTQAEVRLEALLARMGPRSSDPLSQVLSGSSDSTQSSSGVKGCHAREIFIKHMEDLPMIARVTQRNVLQDMGYSQPFPGLMREFIEKRVPLGDMRTLTLLSHFMATGWEIGFNLNDANIMGLMAKGLMMTEQFCLDGGRTTMGWLLSAVAEPNFAAIERNKQRRGLRPYSRLASPSWVAATIAFLKDMDYMESRLKDGTKHDSKSEWDKDIDKDKDKKPKPKPKGKGNGKTSAKTAAAEASEATSTGSLAVSSTCVEMDGTFSPVTSAPEAQEASGYGYSPSQIAMIERLEGLVDYFLAAGDFDSASLGRLPGVKSTVPKLKFSNWLKKWDSKGACALFMCSEVAHDEAVGIFAVAKDETHDRLILNPVVTNGRMQHYSNYTRSLAPGSLVSLIQLAEDEVLRISADDLSEMYYTFKVPPDRARRNCIRTVFKPQEIQHLSCFDPCKHTGPCFVALAALAMGDSLAVEIAQQAHFQVLSQVAGCLLEHERVAYRRAFPRGPFYEFLSIDDHLGLQRISKSAYRASALARDDQVFQAAAKAYRQVGLRVHPGVEIKDKGLSFGDLLDDSVFHEVLSLALRGDDESSSLDRPSYRPWYEDAEWIAEYSDSVHFKELLRWLTSLRAGNTDDFDLVVMSASLGRNAARWLRLLLLLGGDIERNPGPQKTQRSPRGPLDAAVGFAPATSRRMEDCVTGFKLWVDQTLNSSFSSLVQSPHGMALALRAYGMHLFEQGFPRYLYVYAITGIQNLHPHVRPYMSPAWQVDRRWQLHEPGECRPVLSAPVLRAITTLALLWGWKVWLAITLIGFSGMLHPGEFLNLVRQDLVFPRDAMVDSRVMYVHLRNPKTARCRIDDPLMIQFLESVFGRLKLSAKLYDGSAYSYRRQWDSIMQKLEIPFSQSQKGVTPGVLRGSGATHMYLCTEDVSRIAWRGRWTKLKTVEFYLQEVAAQLLLHRLSTSARRRIEIFAKYSVDLLLWFVSSNAEPKDFRGGTASQPLSGDQLP